jgi:hypothetical protein
MFIVWLLIASLVIAAALYLFGWFWYSPIAFGRFYTENPSGIQQQDSSKKQKMVLEFVSCFLLAAGSIFVFAPYNWLFGLINGIVIGIAVILPFAISDCLWRHGCGFKMFFIKLFHKVLALAIAFTLSGVFNSVVMPYLITQA